MAGIKAVYGMLEQVGSVQREPKVINHDNITLGDIPKTLIGGVSSGPLEASQGQTKQTMVGSKVVFGMLEQVGRIQPGQK